MLWKAIGTRNAYISNHYNAFKNETFTIKSTPSRGKWVNSKWQLKDNSTDSIPSYKSQLSETFLQFHKNDWVFLKGHSSFTPQELSLWFIICCFWMLPTLFGCYLFIGCYHILQGYFTGTGAIILPQCQWSNLEEPTMVLIIHAG